MGSSSGSAIIPSFWLSITEWQEAVDGLSIKCGSLYIASKLISKDPLRSFHDEESYFRDAHKIYRMIVLHNFASETEDYQEMLRKEANKDVFFNTEAKMIALHDLIEKGFAPPNSIVHPRLWTLRAQGDDVIMNLGTPSVPKSLAKGQLGSR
ncbi:hypothetical protein Pst134EB_005767 [Puccinia striiformis f. sp. tritici]|nr:hypothetical protein Pst134EB_005767 [Puccinia striiformis f. sp. tritici]